MNDAQQNKNNSFNYAFQLIKTSFVHIHHTSYKQPIR